MSYGKLSDVIGTALSAIWVWLFISTGLAIWKLIEIAIWCWAHIHVEMKP